MTMQKIPIPPDERSFRYSRHFRKKGYFWFDGIRPKRNQANLVKKKKLEYKELQSNHIPTIVGTKMVQQTFVAGW